MQSSNYSLDVILAPLSLFLVAGYHAYIWHSSKSRPPTTAIGLDVSRRSTWLQNLVPTDGKKAMLGVQSSRNALMEAILSASTAIVANASLAALANNTYRSSRLLHGAAFGSQAGSLLVLKYASASLLLLLSFLCSSIAVGCIIQANFLMSIPDDDLLFADQAKLMMERGWALVVVGNRALCIALAFLSWMLGPVPLFVASIGTVSTPLWFILSILEWLWGLTFLQIDCGRRRRRSPTYFSSCISLHLMGEEDCVGVEEIEV